MKMMKMIALVMLAVALAGCGRGLVPAARAQDPAFASYVADFVAEGAARGHDVAALAAGVEIEFGEPGSDEFTAGECQLRLGLRRIVIQRDRWDEQQLDDGRRAILFHELGHCVLSREHRTEFTAALAPVSIMHASCVSGLLLQMDRERLLDELFSAH